jgi:cytochrome c5
MSKEQDAAFFRNLTLVLMLLVVIGVMLAMLGRYFAAQVERDTGHTLAERIAPVGQVNTDPNATLTAALPVASPAAMAAAAPTMGSGDAGANPGKQTYDTVCFACHATGLMNSPKFGDKDAWAPHLSKGKDTLYEHALKGFNQMPAKGGNAALSDDAVKMAVDYMIGAVSGETKASTSEQAPPPAVAAPTTAPAETKTAAADTGSTAGSMNGKGKQIYDTVCFACHAAGVAGAPKFGDQALWAPRIAQGKDTLYKHALEGFFGKSGLMPPKGGRADLADEDIKAAVDYMAAAAQ